MRAATDEAVIVTKVEPRCPRHELAVSGELLRPSFESNLDWREPETA